MRPNVCAVEKNHAEGPVTVFQSLEKSLPYPELRPAKEELCCGPPRAEVRRDGAPFRSILVAPEYSRDDPTKVTRRCLAFRANGLDQVFCQRGLTLSVRNISTNARLETLLGVATDLGVRSMSGYERNCRYLDILYNWHCRKNIRSISLEHVAI